MTPLAAAVITGFLAFTTCLSADSTAGTNGAESPEFLIDLSAKRQAIDHFGANDAWSFQHLGSWSDSGKNRIADLLYTTDKGIGLTYARFYVGAGIQRTTIHDPWRTSETFEVSEGVYDWNRLAHSRWFLRAAKARGVRHFGMTFYSPPLRLTRNGLSNHGSDKTSTTNLIPGGETSYARYIADIARHFHKHPDPAERVTFDRVFPLNEPKWDWLDSQEGCRASNEDMIRIHHAVQSELASHGLPTLIGAPESGSIPGMYEMDPSASSKWKSNYGNYLHDLSRDPLLPKALGHVMTYHSYWSDRIPDQLIPHRQALAASLSKHPGWKLWQTEYCVMEHGRDPGMDTALRVARILHADLAIANASSWQWWLAVSKGNYKDGLLYTDWKKPGDPENLVTSKTFWMLGNYSRFIRPGMRRIDVSGPQDLDGILVSAYLDAPARRIAAVAQNHSSQPRTLRLTLSRDGKTFPRTTTWVPHLTDAATDLAQGAPIPPSSTITLPPRSVVTLMSSP